MRPEFSERVFEFCLDMEFIRRHSAVIVGAPFFPSQRLEADLGYDVEFRLRRGNFHYSLFLQHKVSNFVRNRGGRNIHIYDFHNGPYFYFPLRKSDGYRQHNLLCDLRQSGEEVYYSAPLFFRRADLDQHFVNTTVIDNSVPIDPLEVGPIADLNPHKISYDQNGVRRFWSKNKEMKGPFKFKALREKLERKKVDEEYYSKLLSDLIKGLTKVFRPKLIFPKVREELPPVLKCAYLLRRYYKLWWIVF